MAEEEVTFGCSECVADVIRSLNMPALNDSLNHKCVQYRDRYWKAVKKHHTVHRTEHTLANQPVQPESRLEFRACSLKNLALSRRFKSEKTLEIVRLLNESHQVNWNIPYRIHINLPRHGEPEPGQPIHDCYAVLEKHPILDLTEEMNWDYDVLEYLVINGEININANLFRKVENLCIGRPDTDRETS